MGFTAAVNIKTEKLSAKWISLTTHYSSLKYFEYHNVELKKVSKMCYLNALNGVDTELFLKLWRTCVK